jgi:transcriptional regulator with XRE-family HTH domain
MARGEPEPFGAALRRVRRQRGVGLEALSAKSGISVAMLALYERGKRIGYPGDRSEAVVIALGDPSDLRAAWQREVDEFRWRRRHGPGSLN